MGNPDFTGTLIRDMIIIQMPKLQLSLFQVLSAYGNWVSLPSTDHGGFFRVLVFGDGSLGFRFFRVTCTTYSSSNSRFPI